MLMLTCTLSLQAQIVADDLDDEEEDIEVTE